MQTTLFDDVLSYFLDAFLLFVGGNVEYGGKSHCVLLIFGGLLRIAVL